MHRNLLSLRKPDDDHPLPPAPTLEEFARENVASPVKTEAEVRGHGCRHFQQRHDDDCRRERGEEQEEEMRSQSFCWRQQSDRGRAAEDREG